MNYKIEKKDYAAYKLIISKKNLPYDLEKLKEELLIFSNNTRETKTLIILESRIKEHLEIIIKSVENSLKPINEKYCNPYFVEEKEN